MAVDKRDLAFLESLNQKLVTELDASVALEKELRERIAELESALTPFVETLIDIDDEQKSTDNLWESPAAMSLTVGDLRKAGKALGYD